MVSHRRACLLADNQERLLANTMSDERRVTATAALKVGVLPRLEVYVQY